MRSITAGTGAPRTAGWVISDQPGFGGLIADVGQFGATLRAQHGGLPLFLLGHSMGSFAAQAAILDHGVDMVGCGSVRIDRARHAGRRHGQCAARRAHRLGGVQRWL